VANIVSKNNENLLLFESNSVSSKNPAQQEKNLRRRVYDSLNVLYAVGVLQKGDEKTVYCSMKHDVKDHNEQISKSFTECE
jgi:hypothetical protein